MKKFILTVMVLFAFIAIGFNQEKFATFKMLGNEHEILISIDENSEATLWIDGETIDNIVDDAGIYVRGDNDIQDFSKLLRMALDTYSQWVTIAKENNVTELRRDMDLKAPPMRGFFDYGGYNFTNPLKPTSQVFYFIIDEGDYTLMIRTGEMVSMTNKFITCRGAFWAFRSEKEIQDFIDKTSWKAVNNYIQDYNEKSNLFQ